MSIGQPLISVIIPHQAGTKVLLHCLQALAGDPSYSDLEIIVVDNGSSDGSVDEAKRAFPGIKVVRLEQNQGYAGGCNRGIEVSSGTYVLLLNDDTEIEPGCIKELVRVAEEDPQVGACQPKIRSLVDRSLFEYSGAAGGLMDIYGYPLSRGRLMGHVEADHGQYDDPVEIFWASGVCMLIRKSVLAEVGSLDEVFFAYMEEIDLCWRIHLGGLRIVYVPTAVVYHIGGYSMDQRVLKRMYLNHRNSIVMLLKNYSARSLLRIFPIKILLELCILAGALLRNPKRSLAVIGSFAWLLSHIPTVMRLRASVQRIRKVPDSEISARLYPGMAPVWYFLLGVQRVCDLPDIDQVLHQPYRRDLGSLRGEVITPQQRNFLHVYLDQAPIGLALMRAIECDHLSRLPFRRPILDLGCGDGTFSRVLFGGVIVDAGIDANPGEIKKAKQRRCHADLRVASIEELPFDTGQYATVFSNCVLEHVPDIEPALSEIHRVLEPGGKLYMTVPSPRCTTFLFWRQLFDRLGLRRLASWYANLTLKLFKAEHVMEAEGWAELLARMGFTVEHHEPYMPLRATRIQDLMLPSATLSLLSKSIFDRLLMFPRLHRLKVRLYRSRFQNAYQERALEGSGIMLVARRLP